jgi:hypothetical protein
MSDFLCVHFYLNIMEHNFRVEINAVTLEIFRNLAQQQHLRHGEKISQLHHLCLDPLRLNLWD